MSWSPQARNGDRKHMIAIIDYDAGNIKSVENALLALGIDNTVTSDPEVIRAASVPTAVEFMEREVILAAEKFQARKFPDNSADAYLLLTFDGASREEVDLAWDAAAKTCLANGALDVFISDTPERNESIWSARGAFLEAIKASTTEMDECDVVVPRAHVAEFVLFSHGLQKTHGLRIRSFGHAGDGNLHIYVLRDELGEIFFITLSMDRCLSAYSSEAWASFSEKVSAMP